MRLKTLEKWLPQKIKSMPDAPGVYLMKDGRGGVIYIGKAKSLRKRLLSYLAGGLSAKTLAMMSQAADIECRLTATESLALLLEAELIRRYKPKYNVSLRDDKSFPLVKITNEEFPAIYITREKNDPGARYLGPYTNAGLLREALKIIRRSFPYRSCRKFPRTYPKINRREGGTFLQTAARSEDAGIAEEVLRQGRATQPQEAKMSSLPTRGFGIGSKGACVYYRIGLCQAPCIGRITKSEYGRAVKNIFLILGGKTEDLIRRLSQKMELSAKEQKFEEAAKLRDQINALGSIGRGNAGGGMEGLKKLLDLKKAPERIEAFDVSNISGCEAAGSMVSFYRGLADKNNYRRFRIKTVKKPDDYKMLSEVIHRRYARLKKEKLSLPDLILIDGGLTHLLAAERELKELGLEIPLLSIAKEKENLYTKDRTRPIRLDSDAPALNLIRKIRDEAHRFAVMYHHTLRRKKIIGK